MAGKTSTSTPARGVKKDLEELAQSAASKTQITSLQARVRKLEAWTEAASKAAGSHLGIDIFAPEPEEEAADGE